MIIHIFIVMDYKFLDKVVDQIVRETEIDYVNESIYFPFLLNLNHRYGQMSTTNICTRGKPLKLSIQWC